MPSSISSSEPETTRIAPLAVVAGAAFLSFALYAMLIALWSPDIRAGRDQQSDATIAVERFLYDGRAPRAVIVGSSQAARIPASALDPDVTNLALAGKNPLVGLEIIARAGRIPHRLYIEINRIDEPTDVAFVDAMLAEPGFTLKGYVKALRTTYQPANVLVALLRRIARGRNEVYYPALTDASLHETLIAQRRRELDLLPGAAVLQSNLADLKRLAAFFAAQGTELIFFEMPIEPALEQAPEPVAVRAAALAAFPSDTACWNEAEAPAGLQSTDGIHLDSATAAGFWAGVGKTACPTRQGH